MEIDIQQLMDDWNFIRGNTYAFLEELSDNEFKFEFPRPGLNSFLKQFHEMCDVQESYLDACETGVMTFDKIQGNDDYTNNYSQEEILRRMKSQDQRLEQLLCEKPNVEVLWDGDDTKRIQSQIHNLCMHEALHLGQLIAFSYALGIKIPESVVEAWALS